MLAFTILLPISQAVHRLGTALRGALLVGIDVWTSESIVGSICSDNIVSAAPVIMVFVVMEARTVRSPVSYTIHWLDTAV